MLKGLSRLVLQTGKTMKAIPSARAMSIRAKKRFYKEVGVVKCGDQFEITLDHRKLKTPGGSVFSVGSEALAAAIAFEWESQKDLVMLSQMHLTAMCNTSIDNPTNVTKYDLVDSVLNFLDTDTLLFFSEDDEALYEKQRKEWLPIIEWFCQRYDVDLKPSTTLVVDFNAEVREKIRRQLMSHSFEAVQGLCFGIDATKSIILMLAVTEYRLTAEEAVRLSRLEVDHQTETWGNVEWAHDLELHDTNARVSAAAMVVQCHNSRYHFKQK